MTSSRITTHSHARGVALSSTSPGRLAAHLVQVDHRILFSGLLIYLLIPGLLSLALILMYFSDVEWMQRLIVPNMPGAYPDSIREFGIVENLQNLYLLTMIGMTAYAVRNRPAKWQRWAMTLALVFSIFIFLEEIDYGLHHYEFFAEISQPEAARLRNLHTIGRSVDTMKWVVDTGIVLAFVVAPLVLARSNNHLVRYFLPSRWFILTIVAMVVLSELAHGLERAGLGPGTMENNLSEFRELTIYYLFMIYIYQLAFNREHIAKPQTSALLASSA